MPSQERFKEMAKKIIEKFAQDIGKTIYKRYITETYSTVIGTLTTIYDNIAVYAAFTNITEKEVKDASYRSKHEKILIAGEDLLFAPTLKDKIEKLDGTQHRIIFIKTDMYKALYTLHIEIKNV